MLWALGDEHQRAVVRDAHREAVDEVVRYFEGQAIFARSKGDRVLTAGLVAAAFTHRDSRAVDPDLHTHVAVANKVQTRGGKWLSMYGTILPEHVVAASAAHKTALEAPPHPPTGSRFVHLPRPRGARAPSPFPG